jgi:hypothetical protein
MKRICLLLPLIIFVLINVHGQIRFSKFYDFKKTANLISEVAVLGDSGYFTISESVDFKTKDTLNYLKTYLYFIKTNQLGDTVFTKVYNKPRYNIDGTKFLKTKWGYLLAGNEFDLKRYIESSYGSYLKLWKINEFGDTISTHNYNIQNGNDYAVKIITTSDGGFAILGQTCNQIQSDKKCNYYLMKLDSLGNKQWFKIYKQSNTSFENPNSIIQLPDGTFYLFGQSTLNSIMKWFLVKTDSVGNLLWQKTYNDYPRQAGLDIEQVGIDKLLLVGGYNSIQNGSGFASACIKLIDTIGNSIWNKTYSGNQLNDKSFNSVVKLDNKLLIVGSNSIYDSLNNNQGWLLAINLNGDSLYQRLYNPVSIWPEQIYGINKTNDGFIMSGYGFTKIDSINTQDAWLLKVDTFGCLTPGCQLVGLDNIPFSREEIKIYPNPAKDKIQFKHNNKILSYRVADYTGKLLMAGNYLESGIDIENLSRGVYIVQVLLENKSQAFGKLIVER